MLRVLVVEDDTNLREMVEEWLILEKYTVVTCETGQEAIEQLCMLRFDILLLDWHLSDGTGIEILKHYRKSQGKGIVLMLTGSTTQAEREYAIKEGADGYMSKPFKLTDLSQTLQRLVAGQA